MAVLLFIKAVQPFFHTPRFIKAYKRHQIINKMEKSRIHVIAKWTVKTGELETVLALLSQVAKASVEEKGNLFYKIQQDNTDPNVLLLFEGYRDEVAAAEHRNSSHFQTLVVGKIVPLLEAREINVTTPLTL
jgi:(4S)-4-hydroxy-5-phosphonooxypentane-2,3-dione isomerase